MRLPETISRLNPFRKKADVPQETPEQAVTRRLGQFKKQVGKLKGSGSDLEKFDPQQGVVIEDLLKKREMLVHYTSVPDSTGPSKARDAEEIAKIDARLRELGVNPADISSGEKAA